SAPWYTLSGSHRTKSTTALRCSKRQGPSCVPQERKAERLVLEWVQPPNLESRMGIRRLVLVTTLLTTALASFVLGAIQTPRADAAIHASYDAKLDALRAELAKTDRVQTGQEAVVPAGRVAKIREDAIASAAGRAGMVAEIKRDLQREMGLMPV